MFLYQYILLAGFSCLLLNRRTRFAAFTFLVGWSVYTVTTLGADYTQYYVSAAIIETTIAVVLNERHKYIAYLGYSLIPLNIYGLLVHSDPDGRSIYILIYAAVSIIQFIILFCRLIPDGIRRYIKQRFTICHHNYDCVKTCAKVYGNTPSHKEEK